MDCSSESGKMARCLFYVSVASYWKHWSMDFYCVDDDDDVLFCFSAMEFICHRWETRWCSKRCWRCWKRQIGSLVCIGDRWKMSSTKIRRMIHFLMMEDRTIIFRTGSSLTTTTGIRIMYRNLVNCLQKPWK